MRTIQRSYGRWYLPSGNVAKTATPAAVTAQPAASTTTTETQSWASSGRVMDASAMALPMHFPIARTVAVTSRSHAARLAGRAMYASVPATYQARPVPTSTAVPDSCPPSRPSTPDATRAKAPGRSHHAFADRAVTGTYWPAKDPKSRRLPAKNQRGNPQSPPQEVLQSTG